MTVQTSAPAGKGASLINSFERRTLDALAEAVLIVDRDGGVVFLNTAGAALLGRDRAAVEGAPVTALLAAEGVGLSGFLGRDPDADAPFPEAWEVAFRHADGDILTAELTLGEMETDAGRLFTAIMRDISTRKGIEEALFDTEERLGGITANVPGIVFQRVMQPDGTLYYPFFSGAVEETLGYPPDEVRVNAEGCLDVVHWADRDPLMTAIRASANAMTPCIEEFRAITRDAEVKWLSGTSQPQAMPNGDVLWDGVLIDITERKRAEQRLEMIMDHAADSIVTVSEEGLIESVNRAAETLFGYGEGELDGKNVRILMARDEAEDHDAHITRYLITGEPLKVGRGPRELLGRKQDGTMFPLELSLAEVRAEGRLLFIGVIRDITGRKKTEAVLRATETRLRHIAENMPGIVFQRALTPDGEVRYLYVSEGCRDILGIEPDDLLADPDVFLRALSPGDRSAYLAKLHRSAETMEPVEDEIRVLGREGQTRILRGLSRPSRSETGEVIWDGVALDVTERKEAEERLEYLAYHDSLTGTGNRSKFLEVFARSRQGADRDGTGLAVLSLGLDKFSIINATMGHEVGDRVLQMVAQRLQGTLGAIECIARSGGDRFLVLFGDVHGDSDIEAVADQLVGVFESQPLVAANQEFDLTISVGVSVYPRDGDQAETLIKNADAALQRAKREGMGGVRFYTSSMGKHAAETLTVQKQLRRALENQEFIAFFQPQVDTVTHRIVGAESLARWMDPYRGMISPGVFIPVAEEYGLIEPIAEQILTQSCQRNKAWLDNGLGRISVAVNISGRQFHNTRKLLGLVERVLDETGLPPEMLELELTESSAMSDPANAIEVVRTLNEMNVACSIDDFGTGYSSLSVLKGFPVKKLKIDRSFVKDVIEDPNDAAICHGIIAMSHALNLKVVAEGVETREQLAFLREQKCDVIQGFLFSRPLDPDTMTEAMRAGVIEPGS